MMEELPAIRHPLTVDERLPEWAQWRASTPYTVGVEEEVMLLARQDWSLAHRAEEVLTHLPDSLVGHAAAETHQAVIELATSPHQTVAEVAREAAELRARLDRALAARDLAAAGSGTHPCAVWSDQRVSGGDRYRIIHETMRELARREPTYGLHVHVGVADPEQAVALLNRLRARLPLLLALSANSPFWQGRDTGLAAARIPIFQAFPRVGIPRGFPSYAHYVEAVDVLLRCGAFPSPTFLWWDVRLQPAFGTVEVRIMDAQSRVADTAALAALVQTIAHLESESPPHLPVIDTDELIHENRFRAARDGVDAELLDPISERPVPVRRLVDELLAAGREHAEHLGCAAEFAGAVDLARENGAQRQRRLARSGDLPAAVAALAAMFAPPPEPDPGESAPGFS